MITVSRLLKSCAMPPVSWPTASIFCAPGALPSSVIRSVMSRPMKKYCRSDSDQIAGPGERDGVAVLVHVAAIEIAREPAARLPHLVACAVEVVGEDEVLRAAPDHLVRRVAEDRRELG